MMEFLLFSAFSIFNFEVVKQQQQQEVDCDTYNSMWQGDAGCACKCIVDKDRQILNRVIIDKNCDNVIIRNKKFKTVSKDVTITAPSGDSRTWGLEVTDSYVESIANLAQASIGSEKVVYDTLLLSGVENLPLSDVQPILNTHISSLQQVKLLKIYGYNDNPLIIPNFKQISLLEVNYCSSNISLEGDTFIFPGATTDYSTFTYQPEFIFRSTPTSLDVQIKIWFANTNKHLG